jgi:hypothetical protein
MRPLVVKLFPVVTEPPLLFFHRHEGVAIFHRTFQERCIRSWRPFSSGCPFLIRSGLMPSLISQTARRLNPAMPVPAKG